MKSRITIDVNEDNQPIITINYCASDDIRDKLVKRFLDKFNGESHLARFRYDHYKSDGTYSCFITPVEPKDLEEESKTLNVWVEHLKDIQKVK